MEEIIKKPRALCLLDEFSYHCFLPEFEELIPIDPRYIRNICELLGRKKFDLFLCETVWDAYGCGYDMGNVPSKIRKVRLQEIKALNTILRKLGIPSVFWNKEDNHHYYKFFRFANLFDYVLTTDSRTLQQYKKDCPAIKDVDVMIFAAQPFIHNPIKESGSITFEGDIFFAGKWYEFPDRKKELEEILSLPSYIHLDIYDRSYRGNIPSRFPRRFLRKVKKGLSYKEIVKKYKRYPLMLNTNSVKGSPTMFSRRVPEALACGISVLSTPSKSLQSYFGPTMYFVRNRNDTTNKIVYLLRNSIVREQNNHNARRRILQRHTYFRRVQQICRFLSIPVPQKREGVVILRVVSDNKEKNQELALAMQKQTYPDIITIIPLDLNKGERAIQLISDLFLHRQIEGVKFDRIGFIAVVYPDNEYGADYILDNVLSYQYLPHTKVIGKASIFRRKGDLVEHLYPELEQRFTQFLHPATLVYSLAGSEDDRRKTLAHMRIMLGDMDVTNTDFDIHPYSVDSYSFISGL